MPPKAMAFCLSFLVLCFTSISSAQISAGTVANTTAACTSIDTRLPGVVAFPTRDAVRFNTEMSKYWSETASDRVPACIAFPLNANQTSTVVQVLNNYTDVNFAIKSGGQNPNPGWANIQGGVLIALSSNAATTISKDNKTAYIGPGARWKNVLATLEPYGRAVPGSRTGDVGVGGYLLGGGLSPLSAEYGFGCDSVINYEVVLASGSIINVNATSEPELFFALKGGSNQFGIVTKYSLHTYPIGQIWGGQRVYNASNSTVASTFINATYSFIANYNDTKASIVVSATRNSTYDIFVLYLFYDGPKPPSSIFSAFETFTPLVDTVKTQSYTSLSNQTTGGGKGRYLLREATLPNLPGPNGTALYNTTYSYWHDWAVAASSKNPNISYTIAFQPIPIAIPYASSQSIAGPNALGLDYRNGDHSWMEFSISWKNASDDTTVYTQATNLTNNLQNYAKAKYHGMTPTNYLGGTSGTAATNEKGETGLTYRDYAPIFLNDAMYNQLPLQSYPSTNYEQLTQTKARYDPTGFFSKRTGGFKL